MELVFTVQAADTARALGSGDVEVLATPRLLAWCEAATVAALGGLPAERTSVGTRIGFEHVSAAPVGGVVKVVAEQLFTDGRLVRFTVTATDRMGRLIGTGEVTRVIVDRERFITRIPPA
jgi:predicted thioesterase